ncbi:MAG TPA: AAA family ATPase [Gammaproteobacteria bacterium]|jgi:predicted AAA+ superfamily ATPase|nr:AAA family ATPase [Gammaproteobacteria bacterium]
MYIDRLLESKLVTILQREKSVLLLGPRQTGKTTLINQIPADRRLTLANPYDRLRYEKEPFALTAEIQALAEQMAPQIPLVVIDEIQKIPILMDAIQDLIDRKIAKFILTGSSARKLRKSGDVNLLPGRIIPLRLDPFVEEELIAQHPALEMILLDGTLPEIILQQNIEERESLLNAYVTIYLEEEIRAEAIVRDLGHFARFLELAASESGKIVNFSKLSQEIGVSHSTISGYYQILEDCLITERVEPITATKTRRKLSKTQKYLFYDLGVRRVAAREGKQLSKDQLGHLLEHYVGLELIRLIRLSQQRSLVKYWRDANGLEVDWVIEATHSYIPIEVKWTEIPTQQDAKHLNTFLKEYSEAKQGFIVCRTPQPIKISDNITALPWHKINDIFSLTAEKQ